MARLAYQNKDLIREWRLRIAGDAVPLSLLDEYEQRDPVAPANWVLKPGYRKTLGELIEEKRRNGKLLAVEHLEATAEELGLARSDPVIQINSAGYKGPEIAKVPSRPRVLAVGDSCTFGTLIDYYSYPRAMERALANAGTPAEVINGGVEGYSPRNISKYRLEEFKALRPDITIVYIGWNAIYNAGSWPSYVAEADEFLYSWRAAKLIYARLRAFLDPQGAALRAYSRPKHPDPSAPIVRQLEGAKPEFLRDVEAIVDGMKASGSKVVLVTLPSLYSTGDAPTERALELGHLPDFTDNPYVLAKLAEQYNESLRALAAQRAVRLVDLEVWAKTALSPRDRYFSDSVHLTERGQEKLGTYLATQITDWAKSARK